MNFKVIENHNILDNYNEFKQDYLNPRINVQTIKKKYDLSTKKYNTLRKKVYNETGIKTKPFKTMKNKTTKLINNKTYIHPYKEDKYFIQKKINGKRKSFGIYKDIDTAIKVRNILIKNNWDTRIAEKLKKQYSSNNKRKYEEAEEKYEDFKKLYNNKKSVKEIQETLQITRYQYIHLTKKLNKEKRK